MTSPSKPLPKPRPRPVPYGRAPRMWNTRGELIVYANRGEIADLPRAKSQPASLSPTLPFGIPVVVESTAPNGS
jgi:hypothetical protein